MGDPVEREDKTVMVEMTVELWEVIADTAGAVLENVTPDRLIGPEDIGKQLYSPTLMKHGPR